MHIDGATFKSGYAYIAVWLVTLNFKCERFNVKCKTEIKNL